MASFKPAQLHGERERTIVIKLCGGCDFSWRACCCAQRTFTRMKVISPTYTFTIRVIACWPAGKPAWWQML